MGFFLFLLGDGSPVTRSGQQFWTLVHEALFKFSRFDKGFRARNDTAANVLTAQTQQGRGVDLKLEVGCWMLEVGSWRLEVGCSFRIGQIV